MRRTTKTIVPVAALIVVGAALGIVLLRKESGERTAPAREESLAAGEVVPLADCNIPAKVFDRHSRYVADGIKTIVSDNYQKGMPFVEMLFFARRLDGTVEQIPLDSIGLSRTGPGEHGSTHGLEPGMRGMRLIVTSSNPEDAKTLVPGSTCGISSYHLAGSRSDSVFPGRLGLKPEFRVPENLPPDTVYRVKLIIKDEILEREIAAQKEAEQQRKKQIAEQEKITVRATEPPPGQLVMLYHDGEKGREGYEPNSGSHLLLQGPNKLGGELAVFVVSEARQIRVWAYIPNLRKRQIALPQDAGLIFEPDKFVPVVLTLPSDRLSEVAVYRRVSLYASATAKLPLFGAVFRSADPNSPNSVSVRFSAVPGTYYVRLEDPGQKRQLAVGTIKIEAEPSKTYTIELPK